MLRTAPQAVSRSLLHLLRVPTLRSSRRSAKHPAPLADQGERADIVQRPRPSGDRFGEDTKGQPSIIDLPVDIAVAPGEASLGEPRHQCMYLLEAVPSVGPLRAHHVVPRQNRVGEPEARWRAW